MEFFMTRSSVLGSANRSANFRDCSTIHLKYQYLKFQEDRPNLFASVACPSATPCARLKLTVIAGDIKDRIKGLADIAVK
jgi:hypothetical protein